MPNRTWGYVAPSTYPTAGPAIASVRTTTCGYPPAGELQYSHDSDGSRDCPVIG